MRVCILHCVGPLFECKVETEIQTKCNITSDRPAMFYLLASFGTTFWDLLTLWMKKKKTEEQECIPVGCVPSPAVGGVSA